MIEGSWVPSTVLVFCWFLAGSIDELPEAAGDQKSLSEASSGSGGMRAVKDKETGSFVSPPFLSAPVDTKSSLVRLATAGIKLTEAPGRSSSGGVRVKLGSRFRSGTRVHKTPDEELLIACSRDDKHNHENGGGND